MSTEPPDLPAVARRVLGRYLEREGFHESSDDLSEVEFVDATGVYLRLSYYDEILPPKELIVGLGFRFADGQSDGVGLWALMPDEAPARQYPMWGFMTDSELEAVLIRLRDEVLPLYGEPYWRDPGRLVVALETQREIRRRRFEEELSNQHLTTARRAFTAKDYRTALEHYLLADTDLSEVDQKRRFIARRELGREG